MTISNVLIRYDNSKKGTSHATIQPSVLHTSIVGTGILISLGNVFYTWIIFSVHSLIEYDFFFLRASAVKYFLELNEIP